MDKIAILDFGSQYVHLIANRVRRLSVYSEILDPATPASELRGYKGIILSGGPHSVYADDAVKCDPNILKLGVPLLGICYGHQLLAYMQGGEVKSNDAGKEYGPAEMEVKNAEGIFKGLDKAQSVWMSHGDNVTSLPQGYEVIGSTKTGEWSAIADLSRNFFGLQFHPEVTHTANGMKILENFIDICSVKRDWKIDNFIERKIEEIRKSAEGKKVFMLVSGGVDSSVAFALLNKALEPERIFGLFVDTGFLRLNERDQVEKFLKDAGFTNLYVEDASDLFFKKLENIFAPEEKRAIIGETFLQVQKEVVKKLNMNPDEWLLGQGTIYPDTIESGGTKHAAKIKTHHNRVPEIEEMIKAGKIIEPIAELYKDEVRDLGEALGLPHEMVWRHPFPGPGLAVRCLCAKEEKYPDGYKEVVGKINSEISGNKLSVAILPLQSVGVQGDFRTYRNPLVILGEADFVFLERLSTNLVNQNDIINRAILLLNERIIDNLTVQKSYLTRERISLLQRADDKVNAFIRRHELGKEIWQFPTVLLPLAVNSEKGESIVLRPVESREAMTANFYKMDKDLLMKLAGEILEIDGITAVFYDITNKPPGTIEWE